MKGLGRKLKDGKQGLAKGWATDGRLAAEARMVFKECLNGKETGRD